LSVLFVPTAVTFHLNLLQQREESKFALSDNGIVAVKFRALQDKSNKQEKVVFLLSSDHGNDVSTGKQTKDREVVMKPTCVLDYNKNMGGVDMMDQPLESRKAYTSGTKGCFSVC